jgi:hypothetical protein
LNRQRHESNAGDRRNQRRQRRGPKGERRPHPIPLTEEGMPAATADAPKTSAVVFVSDESRARYPWLPARVIAGSVWRGPQAERVKVDENGRAQPWRSRAA